MSHDYALRKAQCEQKKQYDKKGAQTLRNYWMKKQHMEFLIYACNICGAWHITKGRNHYKNRRYRIK